MAYGVHDLRLSGLQVKTILTVDISHRPGEHGVMELTADLGEVNGDVPVQETGSGQKVTLTGVKAGKQELLFSGVITRFIVESMGRSFHVRLTAKTHSYLMDSLKKSRSFQDTSMTCGTLIGQIIKEYPGAECQILFPDKALGEIAVQYQETDWEFIKRMLSAWHIPVVCSEVRENLSLYAGIAAIPAQMDIIAAEDVWKDMDELSYWKEIGENVQDTDYITYRLRLDNRVSLYSDVSYRGKTLVVEAVEYQTLGGTVYELVTLRKRSGILQRPIYPMQLVGSALDGNILDIRGEDVRIHLNIDDAYQGNDCYWFPYSTPSASSDGSGWYCMPEKGDKVRIYFPSKRTGEVIAISAVSSYKPPAAVNSPGGSGNSGGGSGSGGSGNSGGSGSSGGSSSGSSGGTGSAMAAGAIAGAAAGAAGGDDAGKDKMSDPATKYLRVPSGQEVKLSPKGIEVRCSGGAVKIEVLKNGKVNITAKDTIEIIAEREISMKAKRMLKVHCKEVAYLASDEGGSIHLDKEGSITIKGSEVHMN